MDLFARGAGGVGVTGCFGCGGGEVVGSCGAGAMGVVLGTLP